MTSPDPTAGTVLRPHRKGLQTVLLAISPLVLVAVAFIALGSGSSSNRPMGFLWGALGIFAVVYVILHLVRTRVEFGQGQYRVRSAFTTTRFTADEVAKVVPADDINYGLQSAAHLFIVGKARRRLGVLNSAVYDRRQLEAIVNDLSSRGVPVEHVTGRFTVGQFDRAHPGLFPWVVAHRFAFLGLVAIGVLAVLGIVAAIAYTNLLG